MATPDKTFIVAAIDFGTTFSGFAYSFISDYKKDPLTIYSTTWENDGNGTQKTPTSILFDDKEKFHSFGYEAEKKYSDLAAADELDEDEDNESDMDYRKWFYFRRFKMALFRAVSQGGRPKGKRIKEDMQLTAANGKKMSALKVFSEAIRYLKEQLDEELEKRLVVKDHEGKSMQQDSWADDVRWVLTIPAIWSNEAKQFMRMAAEQAGIAKNQLKLALEPEAAAILCKQVALSKDKEESEVKAFQPGSKFMVVDCGGGTVDVTAHEVVGGGGLKELHHATGDALGGTNVDRKFFSAMTEWLGEDVMKRFEKESTSDWLEFERNFESKKRSIGRSDEEYITFSNLGELCRIYKELKRSSVKSRMAELKLEGKVNIMKENKFRFRSGFLKDLVYRDPICDLVNHIEKLFLNLAVSEIKIILLVGGFSECPILYEKIKDTFPNKVVINPAEANLAVLKGAVIFGHKPATITERLSPRYYGIATDVPFQTGIHPEKLKMNSHGMDVCTDVFKCMIKKNAPLTRIQETFTLSAYKIFGNIEVYESDELQTYCTDCRMLGKVVLDIEDYTFQDKRREVDVSLEFGSTELYVIARDKSTKRTVTGKFNFSNR